MSSPIARRSAVARLLAVQIIILVVFFIGTGLLLVPTAAKTDGTGSSGNRKYSSSQLALAYSEIADEA